MNFTNTFIRSAINIFAHYNYGYVRGLNSNLSLDNSNLFNKFLVTRINNNEFEVPIIMKDYVEAILDKNIDTSTGKISIDKIVLPLYENSFPLARRTFNSIFTEFFYKTSYDSRLLRIDTNKDETYYGGKGIIFDKNYNPLILCTIKVKMVGNSEMYKLSYYKPIVHVNPIVFEEPSTLINKSIIKNIIPFYTNYEIRVPIANHTVGFCDSISSIVENKASIIIDDSINKFFEKPTIPNSKNCTTESLNEFIVDNIDEIMQFMDFN